MPKFSDVAEDLSSGVPNAVPREIQHTCQVLLKIFIIWFSFV